MFYFDPYLVALFVATLLISALAQFNLRRTYARYGALANGSGLSGLEVGVALVRGTSLGDRRLPDLAPGPVDPGIQVEGIRFSGTAGELSDHYDPSKHTVFLSRSVANEASVAAMAIVAHELGHAEQRETSSLLLGLRGALVPAIRVSPTLAYVSVAAGLLLGLAQLIWLGVLFYGAMVLFVILDLPVEIDASRRALRLLRGAGLLVTAEDEVGTRRVLGAAATTYLAAALGAVLQLLYYLSLARRRS